MANIVINGELLLGDGHLMETDHEAIRLGDRLRLSALTISLGCALFLLGRTVKTLAGDGTPGATHLADPRSSEHRRT